MRTDDFTCNNGALIGNLQVETLDRQVAKITSKQSAGLTIVFFIPRYYSLGQNSVMSENLPRFNPKPFLQENLSDSTQQKSKHPKNYAILTENANIPLFTLKLTSFVQINQLSITLRLRPRFRLFDCQSLGLLNNTKFG